VSVTNDTTKRDALLKGRVSIPQGVVYRTFVKETVILNLEMGLYHGLNPSGGRMLAALEQSGTVREAAARVAREYNQPVAQIEEDLCEFCEALIERGLLKLESA
jgi:hypothetical protein